MIAKANWFTRRKYTGWGLTPRTWQGFAYIVGIALLAAVIQSLPIIGSIKLTLMGIWIVFVLVDVLQTMAAIKLDEREQKIEAIAERNASWTMVTATVISVLYISTLGKELKGVELMPILITPVLIGTIAKGLTNYILDKRGI